MSDDSLARYLRTATGRRFAWGEHDCALFVADWVRQATGHDAAGAHRGAYRGRQAAAEILGRGGLPAFFRRAAAAAGLVRTRLPARGDVGVILLDDGLFCAIRTHIGWALPVDGGLVVTTPRRVVVAYAVDWAP